MATRKKAVLGLREVRADRSLKEVAHERLGVEAFLEDLKRGGTYVPLFGRREEEVFNGRRTVWLNAWLLTAEEKERVEAETLFKAYPYFQQGFHPSVVLSGRQFHDFSYEPIYGGPGEPLVLGWSADARNIDASLSQEFERCYQLSALTDATGTRWNSWQQPVDDVVIRELSDRLGFVIAHVEFVRDYQDLRQRWLIIPFWAEWQSQEMQRDPGAVSDGRRRREYRARRRGRRRLRVFGLTNAVGDDFYYVEANGYFLAPPPRKRQFSRTLSGTPSSVEELGRGVRLQTSHGKVHLINVRNERHRNLHFVTTAVFDQEVLQRYQDEGAEVATDQLGQIMIRSRRLSLTRGASALGAEYVSVMLGYFVEGVPETEWGHWQRYNVSYVGNQRHRELSELPSLFSYGRMLERLPEEVNRAIGAVLPEEPVSPFQHKQDNAKDRQNVIRALPRHANLTELLGRAQALDALVIQRLSQRNLRMLLRGIGYRPEELGDQGALRLFTQLIASLVVMRGAVAWTDPQAACEHSRKKFRKWRTHKDAGDEDVRLIQTVVAKCEPLFGIHGLRIESSHPMQTTVAATLKDYFGYVSPGNNFRDAALVLYRRTARVMEDVVQVLA